MFLQSRAVVVVIFSAGEAEEITITTAPVVFLLEEKRPTGAVVVVINLARRYAFDVRLDGEFRESKEFHYRSGLRGPGEKPPG